jgi:predicted DNA-binding protein (MmcQ/YjbR family)
MTLDTFHDFCTGLPLTTAEFPFGPSVMVFKVAGKMFALANADTFASVNLKCDPEIAVELRERYAAVQPGYHMNKQQGNTVLMDGSISRKLLLEWTRHSYDLIVAKLPMEVRGQIRNAMPPSGA